MIKEKVGGRRTVPTPHSQQIEQKRDHEPGSIVDPATDPDLRFWSRVDRPRHGCWPWQGACSGSGYGSYRVGSQRDGTRRMVLAHRYAWQQAFGEIGAGLQLDHVCGRRDCVRPTHLRPVTRRQNKQHVTRVGSATGYRNVYARGDCYFAQVQRDRHAYTAPQRADLQTAVVDAIFLRLLLFTHSDPDLRLALAMAGDRHE